MAAFHICLRVWLASSLLADGLAVAGQGILASAFAEKDYEKATAAASRVLQMSFVLGLGLSVVVGLGLQFGDGIFTSDKRVLRLISVGVPVRVAIASVASLFLLYSSMDFRYLGCIDHLLGSTYISWDLEDGNKNRTVALSKNWLLFLTTRSPFNNGNLISEQPT